MDTEAVTRINYPSFEWIKGHSGALLPEEVTAQLDELFEE
jgi:hypothetical protein